MISLFKVIEYSDFEKHPWQKEGIQKLSEILKSSGLLEDNNDWVKTFRGLSVFNPNYELVLNYLKSIWADVNNFKVYHESLVKFISSEGLPGNLGKLGYCHFLSQSLKETYLFHCMIEYGNYDYFQPYADHPDLGNEGSHDLAFKYRGAGAFHTTGKHNYSRLCSIIGDPKILEVGATHVAKRYPVESGQVFWKDNNISGKIIHLQKESLEHQCEIITKVINGGLNGFDERLKYFTGLIKLFDKI